MHVGECSLEKTVAQSIDGAAFRRSESLTIPPEQHRNGWGGDGEDVEDATQQGGRHQSCGIIGPQRIWHRVVRQEGSKPRRKLERSTGRGGALIRLLSVG
jgi:hypothetical protein